MITTPDSLSDLRERLRQFAAERDWEQFHLPKEPGHVGGDRSGRDHGTLPVADPG